MKINREADVLSGEKDLEHLYTFKAFPVFMGCTNAPQSSDVMLDMSFWISRSSGMIQLNPVLELDALYPEAHGAGCIGASWAKHHRTFAEFIGKFHPSSVLEIGGAHGILATEYQAKQNIPWTILEPNPTPIQECRATIVKGFFDENFRIAGDIDTIVHSHVFEHIYAPDLFVKHLSSFLKPGQRLIFSVPNMRVMLERKYTNCLNFEHTICLTDDYIEYLLAKHGFRLLEKSYFLDDHSIFYSTVRDNALISSELPASLYSLNRALYLDYISFHQKLVDKINKELSITKSKQVFVFGAHVQAQYLIGFGLDLSNVDAILDNDPNKRGKRLFGTDKWVKNPNVLAGLSTPTVVVRAGTFTTEVVAQLKAINPTVKLIT